MSDTFDVGRARRDTAATARLIHFNNAGAALMPDCVVETMIDYIRLENEIGGYEAAALRAPELNNVYRSIATLLNCDPGEIALVENATRAWDMAFFSMRFEPGDRILTSSTEYASNYIAFLQRARREGIRIDVVPDDADGAMSVDALAQMIDRSVKLISATHVPTNGGLVNPIEAIGAIAGEHRIPYLVDACQSIGQIDIDVRATGCDMLVASGRKYLRGPRGTGFLYVSGEFLDRLDPIFLDLHGATWEERNAFSTAQGAKRFESWEFNAASRLGLGRAIDYTLEWGMPAIEARVSGLGEQLRQVLSQLPGICVHDKGLRRCGLVGFSASGVDPEELQRRLNGKNVNVDVSYASSTLLDITSRDFSTMMRASEH